MNPKHTSGPWYFASKHATHIANQQYPHGFIDVPKPSNMSEEEWEANKRLIQSSPELFDILRDLLVEYSMFRAEHNRTERGAEEHPSATRARSLIKQILTHETNPN